MAKVMFGDHPYSIISPTEEMLDALTRDDLLSFRRSMFIPNNGVLLVVGDFESASLTAQIEELFAQWPQGPLPQLISPALPKRSERTIYLVDRPGSAQSNIVIVNEAITRTSLTIFLCC
jgi:zinc protease